MTVIRQFLLNMGRMQAFSSLIWRHVTIMCRRWHFCFFFYFILGVCWLVQSVKLCNLSVPSYVVSFLKQPARRQQTWIHRLDHSFIPILPGVQVLWRNGIYIAIRSFGSTSWVLNASIALRQRIDLHVAYEHCDGMPTVSGTANSNLLTSTIFSLAGTMAGLLEVLRLVADPVLHPSIKNIRSSYDASIIISNVWLFGPSLCAPCCR